jgi:hypothetical protein
MMFGAPGESIPDRLLEQRLFAHQYGGLPLKRWLELRILVEKALAEGVIDRGQGGSFA